MDLQIFLTTFVPPFKNVNAMSQDSFEPIVERLKQYIAEKGLTNTQFADRAGIPRPTLSQILHGRNKTINDVQIGRAHV